MDLPDIYRIFRNIKQFTFYSVVHGYFSKRGCVLRNKTTLSKYRKTEVILDILSFHYAKNLKIDIIPNSSKCTNSFKLNN